MNPLRLNGLVEKLSCVCVQQNVHSSEPESQRSKAEGWYCPLVVHMFECMKRAAVGFGSTWRHCATYQFGIRPWVQRCRTGPPLSPGRASACSFQKNTHTHTDIWKLEDRLQGVCSCTVADQTVTRPSSSQLVAGQDSHRFPYHESNQ